MDEIIRGAALRIRSHLPLFVTALRIMELVMVLAKQVGENL